MLVDIMTIVSYNSKYKAKTNKMQQKYRKILEKELEWIHCYIHSLKKWLMKIM